MMETRKTPLGRSKAAPRISPTYGTARQRRERKRREAEARQLTHDNAMKAWKESQDAR